MIVTTTTRVFFHWYEYEALVKFEKENPLFKIIAEDTRGTTFECSTYYVADTERKEE